LTSVSIREEYAYPKSKLLRRIGRPLLFFDGSERVLYDLERLKLRIYGEEGVVQKMRSICSMLIDHFDVNSVGEDRVAGRHDLARSLSAGKTESLSHA
jgi:hypothetical protein